jgi:hypothetical protein
MHADRTKKIVAPDNSCPGQIVGLHKREEPGNEVANSVDISVSKILLTPRYY